MGESLKEASQAVFWEHYQVILRVALEHGTLSYAHIITHWTSALSQSFEFLSLLWVTRRNSQHPLHYQVLFHVMFCFCALVFKGSIHLDIHPSQVSCLKTCVSPCLFDLLITSPCPFCVVDGGYIKALPRRVYSCRLQHIIQELDLETS